MKIEEIRGKTEEELASALEKMKQELFSIRFRRATETSANPARIRTLRRAIARVTTVIHQRGPAAVAAPTASKVSPKARGKASATVSSKAASKVGAESKQVVQAGKKGAR